MSASSQRFSSAQQTRDRFNSEVSARKYAGALGGTATHRREVRCVRAALAGLAAGARLLDLPSGTGRLLPLLIEMGFRVTEADSSCHMIEQARKYAEAQGIARDTEFRVEDALATRFEDNAFDAVLCNRLFHHFNESEIRQRCLRELSRICRGPIVVSFFCNSSLGAVAFHLRNWLRRKTPTDRIPIPRRRFIEDAQAVGLSVVRTMAARPWISKQWYAVLTRAGRMASRSSRLQS